MARIGQFGASSLPPTFPEHWHALLVITFAHFFVSIMAERDEMENRWGVDLVPSPDRLPSKTISQFQAAIKKAVSGFQLLSMTESGTSANETAVLSATDNDSSRCLFAMGSYCGGVGIMFRYSSTQHSASKQLSVPSSPGDLENKNCKQQTVALPYYVPCAKYTDASIRKYEQRCLKAINTKLFVAQLAGCPYRAILLELVLCGTGGELSNIFLASMGKLCDQYSVSIIVDEVMTGGRVGPDMTVTVMAPPEFTNQVAFITMGKFMGCGLVLTKVPLRPTDKESTRGKSTEASPDLAYSKWQIVVGQLAKGTAEQRRQQVITIMDAIAEEDNWGQGCMIFTRRSRPGSTKGLKNRHLPRLEDTKLYKGATKSSEWTRSSVCDKLIKTGEKWITEMNEGDNKRLPFISCFCKYVLETTVVDVTAAAVLKYVGEDTAVTLATKERERHATKTGRNCSMKAPAFMNEALGVINVNAEELVKRVRIGCKRKLVYKLDRAKLAIW